MNKYKYLIIICFFVFSFSISKVYANILDLPLLGKTIYLDAGHGGKDAGAIVNNLKEKDINLIIVKKLEKELNSKGAVVYLTRNDDYDLASTTVGRKRSDLYNRAKLINNSNSDIYISIHLNSTTSSKWRGLQVFYSTVNKENKAIGEVFYNTFKNNLSNVRELKKENSYYMYRNIKVPGVLIEAGFISNPSDNYILRSDDYQNTLVNNIVNGVINYFNK